MIIIIYLINRKDLLIITFCFDNIKNNLIIILFLILLLILFILIFMIIFIILLINFLINEFNP